MSLGGGEASSEYLPNGSLPHVQFGIVVWSDVLELEQAVGHHLGRNDLAW